MTMRSRAEIRFFHGGLVPGVDVLAYMLHHAGGEMGPRLP